MTESRRRGNAGRHAWAIWMLAVGLWIGMSIPALAAIPTTVTIDANRGADGSLLLTATVTPAEAAGTVQFKIDGVNTGSPVPVTAGTAQAVPIADLPPGNYTIGAEYSGDANYSPSGASMSFDHADKAFAHISLSYDQTPGPQLVPIIATIDPPDATGTVQFELDYVPIGFPVTVVAGRAESLPVDIPDRASYWITANYSGDDNYLPVSAGLHVDWRPDLTEEEAAAVAAAAGVTAAPTPTPMGPSPLPASSKPRTLPRAGSETIPLALLASAVLGTGFVLLRKGTAGTSRG